MCIAATSCRSCVLSVIGNLQAGPRLYNANKDVHAHASEAGTETENNAPCRIGVQSSRCVAPT